MASTFKCVYCKEFFPKDKMIKTNFGNLHDKSEVHLMRNRRKSTAFKNSKTRKSNEITSQQEAWWLERVTQFGYQHGAFPDRLRNNPFQRHHIKGRKFVHNKRGIGMFLVLPISDEFHDPDSNNPCNVTHYPTAFEARYGEQVFLFLEMCEVIKSEDGELPFDDNDLAAIKDLLREKHNLAS